MKYIFSTATVLGILAGLLFLPADSNALMGIFGGKYKSVKANNGMVAIPINTINDGKAHYFKFKARGKTINFFVLKSKDGIIRAAFDACDVCFPKRKGYTQSGDYMICNNCGQRFHSTKINVLKGGCNPAPLRRIAKGPNLQIAVADILTGARYF